MNTNSIYDDLEEKLSQFWIEQKDVKISKEAVSQYFKAFADLRYFADRTTGKFFYNRDSQGNFIGLDYNVIYINSPELTILKADKSIDKEKSNKYILEAFMQTNEAFYKIKAIDELSNDSRLHNRFGIKGRLSFNLPQIDLGFLAELEDASAIYGFMPRYFSNALKLAEKMAPQEYKVIFENFKSNTKMAMNSFLTLCETKHNKSGDKNFNMGNYLDEKIMNIVSALDDIDKEECSNPLMKNRATDLFVMYLSPDKKLFRNSLVDEKIFSRHASNDMKIYLETLNKSSRQE